MFLAFHLHSETNKVTFSAICPCPVGFGLLVWFFFTAAVELLHRERLFWKTLFQSIANGFLIFFFFFKKQLPHFMNTKSLSFTIFHFAPQVLTVMETVMQYIAVSSKSPQSYLMDVKHTYFTRQVKNTSLVFFFFFVEEKLTQWETKKS